jgi:hypothetical protein
VADRAIRATARERLDRAEQAIANLDSVQEVARATIEAADSAQRTLSDLREAADEAYMRSLALLWLYKRDVGRAPNQDDYRRAIVAVEEQTRAKRDT